MNMVSVVVRNPDWFLNTDVFFSVISIFVSLIIIFVSFRAWRLTKEVKYFGLIAAFLAFAFGFFTRMVANIYPDPLFFYIGYGLHILSTIFAFLTLFLLANKITNPRVFLLFYLLVFPLIYFSGSYFFSFYITTSLITCLLALTYFQNLIRIKKFAPFCVFSAFFLLFLAHIQFLLSSLNNIFYYTASISQLLGFILFLLTIVKVLKK
jgi:hypothetical protein